MQPGAPILHDKGPEARILDPKRNLVADVHGNFGDVEKGFAQADAIHEGTYYYPRIQHAHLETLCAIAWIDAQGRLNMRSSTQVPFLTRQELARVFGLEAAKVRVFCERVGGGFGAKQEMMVEDIAALAALKTGRPVKIEFTREEQFIAATTRHPMKVKVKIGAKKDGTLTAIQMHVISNTGAYGNHGAPVLEHACSELISVYACENKKVDGYAVYTNTVPAGAFRGYGLPQTSFAIEQAIDEVARMIGIDALEFRRRNVVRKGDADDRRACLARRRDLRQLWPRSMHRSRGQGDEARRRRQGAGKAGKSAKAARITMIDTVPPGGHYSDTHIWLRPMAPSP